MATATSNLGSYAQQLADLKKTYMGATTAADRTTASQKGNQIRSQAYGSGIDLDALESEANKLGGITPDAKTDQAFRTSTFAKIKSSPTYTAPSAAGSGQSDTSTPSARFSNDYIEKASGLMTQLEKMMQTPVTFTPETDPTYIAAQKLADAGAKTATRNTLETMNDRGIVNSSITASQLGQIEQEAELKPLELIPQLQQQAYSQNQQQISNLGSLMQQYMSTGLNQQQFDAEFPMKEAALTGKYQSGEVKSLVDQLLELKTAAENPFTTADERNQYKLKADGLRKSLSTYGVDADALFGSGVNSKQAAVNASKAGTMTMDAQQTILNTLLGLTDAYGSVPSGSGQKISSLPGLSGLGSIFSSLEGQSTLSKDQTTFNQGMATKEFNLNSEKFTFDKTVTENAMKIDNANLALNKAKQAQDLDYNRWLLDNQKTEVQGTKATSGYMSQLLSTGSREAAMSYIVTHAQDIVNDGANVNTLLSTIDSIYPTPKATSSSSSESVVEKAVKMAQNDLTGWTAADTPEKQQELINKYIKMLGGTPGATGTTSGE